MRMLRKSSHIILSALLLFATVGLVISKHYCSGSRVSTSFFAEAKSCCDDSDCCHNESKVYQLHEDFTLVSLSEIPQTTEFEFLDFAILTFNVIKFDSEETEVLFVADLPPPPKIQTILAQNQAYLL